jgi:predicted transglutaminase-like cysteine proteinase
LATNRATFRLAVLSALIFAATLLGFQAGAALDFDRLQQSLVARFGPSPTVLFGEWRQMLANGQNAAETDKLRRVNDFFNRRITFDDDYSIWGQSDYWATPLETIGKGRADCEDFAIGKYYSLLNLGIPIAKLRLVYVRATQEGPGGLIQQAHMVLVYYATPNADPLVLDNLIPEIRPASRRPDLAPIFSFNSAGLWQGTGNQSSKSNLSRWQDLLSRARAEGFQ